MGRLIKLIIIAAVIVGLAMYFMVDSEPVMVSQPSPETPSKTELRNMFMEGCVDDGGASKEYCSCFFDQIMTEYTIGQAVDLAVSEPTDESNAVFKRIGEMCTP